MRGASRSSVRTTGPVEPHDKVEETSPQPSPVQGIERAPADTAATDGTPSPGEGLYLPSLIISEIGLGRAPVPSLASRPDQQEASDDVINVIEFLNPTDSPTETQALTVELINPACALIRLVIPDGVAVPAGGSFAICQPAGVDADPTVFAQVLDAQGFVVNSAMILGAVQWDLGRDASEGLAVNLVCRAGGWDEAGIDTFVANLKRPDLAALSSPLDFGVASRSKPIFSENFETYFAGLSTAPNIFSRVLTEDVLEPAARAVADLDGEAPGAGTKQVDPSLAQAAGKTEGSEAVAPEGPEGGTIAKAAGRPKNGEDHGRQHHRGRGAGRFGRKAPRPQKPGSGGFRSGV